MRGLTRPSERSTPSAGNPVSDRVARDELDAVIQYVVNYRTVCESQSCVFRASAGRPLTGQGSRTGSRQDRPGDGRLTGGRDHAIGDNPATGTSWICTVPAMPSALIEVRRPYSEAEEMALIDALHGALVAAFRIPPEDKHIRLVAHTPHRFAVGPGLSHPDRYTLVSLDVFAGRSMPTGVSVEDKPPATST